MIWATASIGRTQLRHTIPLAACEKPILLNFYNLPPLKGSSKARIGLAQPVSQKPYNADFLKIIHCQS
jgi:hypothetical protein